MDLARSTRPAHANLASRRALDAFTRILALLVLVAMASCAPAHRAQTPHNGASAALERKTVALVATRQGSLGAYCSGVWVRPNAILTANHCVREMDTGDRVAYVVREELVADAGDSVEAVRFSALEARDAAHDLALLRVRLAPEHAVAELSSAIVGQNVQTMGHPLGLWWSYSTGQVAAIRKVDFDGDDDSKGIWYVQSTAPISPGNSGGGLFDENGNLIGLAHAYMPRGENVNMYISATYIAEFLEGKQ